MPEESVPFYQEKTFKDIPSCLIDQNHDLGPPWAEKEAVKTSRSAGLIARGRENGMNQLHVLMFTP